ncbi:MULTISPECIES: VWA domain-containing protein [Paenibacillus]|uniref:vWA domain-containing protein n=1 Tax=Paenibacillus TaxID=44249 RepID=UPI002FE0F880
MEFASWAGLWFGLALPVIVIMYLFKRKYTDTLVPSHMLWNRVLRNMEANRPWQKLQNRLLLWLQLLAAALLVAALMLPFVRVQGGFQGHTVIIMDTSASMSAAAEAGPTGETGSESRLDRMRDLLVHYIGSKGSNEEITLLQLGGKPRVLLSRELDKAKLRQAVSGISPDYGRAAYRETLSLASALTRSDSRARIVLFSDSPWNEVVAGKQNTGTIVPVEYVPVEAEGEVRNTAIEQFGVKSPENSEANVTGVAVVKNHGSLETKATLNLYGDGELLATEPVALQAGARSTVSFEGLPAADVYRLAVEGADAYAPDDEAFAFRERANSPNVLLLSPGNLFLEKALQLTGVRLSRMQLPAGEGDGAEGKAPALPETRPDLIVVDGPLPDLVQEGEWAVLLKETPLWSWENGGGKIRLESGEIQIAEHPVTRYLTMTDPPAGQLWPAKIPPWAKPIWTIGGQPAAYAGTENGVPRLVFLFDLKDGDLPLRPEFPILVKNAVEWLQFGGTAGLGRAVAGSELEIPFTADTARAVWAPLEGYAARQGTGEIPVSATEGEFSARQQAPGVPGLWSLRTLGNDGTERPGFLLEVTADPAESSLRGPALPEAAGAPPAGGGMSEAPQEKGAETTQRQPKTPYSLVYPAVILAIAAILTEWGVYRRGRSIS